MKLPGKTDWVLSELMMDPQRLFVLWAIKVRFCVSLDDFHKNYGSDFPITKLVDDLRQDGFLRQDTGDLVLTETGGQAVTCLGHNETTRSGPDSLIDKPVSGLTAEPVSTKTGEQVASRLEYCEVPKNDRQVGIKNMRLQTAQQHLQFKFKGSRIAYRSLRNGDKWGSFYVENSKRSHRPRPLNPGPCPFCNIAFGKQDVEAKSIVRFDAEEYIVVPNHNPIVEDQTLFFPQPARNEMDFLDHRIDLNAMDVRVIEKLTTGGFSSLRCERVGEHNPLVKTMSDGSLEEIYNQPWVAYVNAYPGAGRSVTHLHINCVPAHHIPLLKAETAPWLVSQGASKETVISRFKDTSFYGLVVEGDDCNAVADTLARLHREMNNWEIPYNLIAYPSNLDDLGPRRMRIAVIPRDQEYCEAADQRIAGLEFVTGILIPGINRIHSMDTIQRDQAFSQATLKDGQRLELERHLRDIFGMPPVGVAVYPAGPYQSHKTDASSGSEQPLKPVVLPNTELDDPGLIEYWRTRRPEEIEQKNTFEQLRLKPNVLVRITRASICQSDRRIMLRTKKVRIGENEEPPTHFVLGHEAGGYVVDPGPWENELKPGQKVAILPHLTCGTCDACARYMQNLCHNLDHLGFKLNGNMAQLMSFPYQCVLAVDSSFPDSALPLVEPLACVLRALFRIKDDLSRLSSKAISSDSYVNPFTVFGAGPMGCLAARAVKRFWPDIRVTMIEPIKERCVTVEHDYIADKALQSMPRNVKNLISFVASSKLQASFDAIASTRHGGTIMLFSGINTDELGEGDSEEHKQGKHLEHIHRWEHDNIEGDSSGQAHRLIGSSGYNFDDSSRSVFELTHHYEHYKKVQNVELDGLMGTEAHYLRPKRTRTFQDGSRAVEALLSPKGVYDEVNGTAIAEMIKVLIRL